MFTTAKVTHFLSKSKYALRAPRRFAALFLHPGQKKYCGNLLFFLSKTLSCAKITSWYRIIPLVCFVNGAPLCARFES